MRKSFLFTVCVLLLFSSFSFVRIVAQDQSNEPTKDELVFQGKIFEQWVYDMKTELDPKMQCEIFRALAAFGANGRGKEVTELIFKAAKNYDFSFIAPDSMGDVKHSIIDAFGKREGRIPVTDSMATLLQKYSDGSMNEKRLVEHIFLEIVKYQETKEFLPTIFEKIVQWDLEKVDDKVDIGHPRTLFALMARIRGGDEYVLRFLKETIAQNDVRRFQWAFYTFNPEVMERDHNQFSGVPIFNLYPEVAFDAQIPVDNRTGKSSVLINNLSGFGESLVELLRESGFSSSNETIRERSKAVVDAIERARHR
ncbi:MAG: hypothetical protein LBU65_06725 [Planctomycetaceae bacterium]|nr:hypothetical protein [Planctomycetaceae bacterium]